MIVSIDLGGTKMLTTIIDDLTLVARHKIATPLTTKGTKLLKAISSEIEFLLAEESIAIDRLEGIALSVPSPVNFKKGIILSATNIGVQDYPIRDRLREKFGVPVILENDVNAGLFGELHLGAAQGAQQVVGMYPGTGIGGALILNGELYRGVSGGAAEFGHIVVQAGGRICGCGGRGCLEALASKTAIAKDIVHLAAIGKAPSILKEVGTDFARIKSSHILRSMEAGEEAVIDLVQTAAKFLGIGMACIVNSINPELIVLGGGLVEKLGKSLITSAEFEMRSQAMPHLHKDVKVRSSKLGDNSVVLGAALILKQEIDNKTNNASLL